MKKLVPILLLALSASTSKAQTPFPTIDSVNINNINASVLVHGDMWWNGNPATGIHKCFYPNGTQKNIAFASALWMAGYDGASQLHVAAQTYRQHGNDYWPGPLNSSDTLTYATSQDWAKIWKINRTTIDSFLGITTHTTTNTPSAILTWPAKGNTYATGNAGVALTITEDMAPFVDLNGNGIYEPLLGEYPDVKGDQALWWVFSDNGPTHNESHGKPLGVEIHAISYAYKRGTLLDNVIYYEYTIKNKSANTYNNFRIGQYADMDLGYPFDDFIGFDSAHRMAITYNGENDDFGVSTPGSDTTNWYGKNIPVVGVTMIALPGDAPGSYVPAGSFDYYNNDASVIGNPTNDSQYNNYLRAKKRDGTHFTNGAGISVNYVFASDPTDTAGSSECATHDVPGDRRTIIASNDFTLAPGTSEQIVMALIVTPLDTNNACPDVSFAGINTVADTAWQNYYNLPELSTPVLTTNTSILIYPNPTHAHLFIDDKTTGTKTIVVYNTLGQQVNVNISAHQNSSDISVANLPPSVYYIKYNNGITQKTFSFVKE